MEDEPDALRKGTVRERLRKTGSEEIPAHETGETDTAEIVVK
jgi:hypothetical protein